MPDRRGYELDVADPLSSVTAMELDRNWEATVADTEGRERSDDGGTRSDTAIWHPIDVPGHWRNHPTLGTSDGPILYRNRFIHPQPDPGDRWWLRFDGVFYQGDVWLDDAYVGDTEGYFFPHTFEVTDALAARTHHELEIEVTCSPQLDPRMKRNITGVFQHWDAADHDANPGGIWRPVHLQRTGPVRIRHLRVICTDADEDAATVAFRAVLDSAAASTVTLRSTVGDVELAEHRRLAAGENQVEWQIHIDEPELWWPYELGDPVLHDVIVEVIPHLDDHEPTDDTATSHSSDTSDATDDTTHSGDARTDDPTDPPARLGPVSHRLTRRIGLRSVRLRGWVLHVNGRRLFLRGANLGPTRMDLGDADPQQLRDDIALARTTNLNLVRVHGHITRPELYDAADETGMLLWQDFPLQWGYARTIRKQATRQAREAVDLLGHHPSLVIWCGHNDPERIGDEPAAAGVGDDGARSRLRHLLDQGLPSWNRTILDRSVKRAIDSADSSRPVIPHSGVLPHPPQLDGTDTHLFHGWYQGEAGDLADLARTVPRMVRFVSRFGAQSVPDSDAFIEPDTWPDLDWERLERHHGLEKAVFDVRVPPAAYPSFDTWRKATQRHQSEVLVRQIEILRRLKYRPTGGFALYLLADAQPAISWSLVDHDRIPKPAHEAVREVCRPVIGVVDALPATMTVGRPMALDTHVVSDRHEPVDNLELHLALRWSGGEHHWRFAGAVDADTCTRIGTVQFEVPDAPGPVELELELIGDGDEPYRRTHHGRITSA